MKPGSHPVAWTFASLLSIMWITREAEGNDVCSQAGKSPQTRLHVGSLHPDGTKGSSSRAAALLQKQPQQGSPVDSVEEPPHEGALAPLTAEGYLEIINLKDDDELAIFAHRVSDSMGLEVSDKEAFHEFAQDLIYGGHVPENLEALKDVIIENSEGSGATAAFSLAQIGQVSGRSASLNQEGFRAVQALSSGQETEMFVRRVAESFGLEVTNTRKLHELVHLLRRPQGSFSILLTQINAGREGPSAWLHTASSISPPRGELSDAEPSSPNIGREGRSRSSAVASDTDTSDENADEAEPVSVTVDHGHTPAKSAPNPRHQRIARTAALDERGYATVADLKDKSAMKTFLERAVSNLGYRIVSKGGIEGMVPYYDGQKATQSYAALKADLARTSKKRNAWLMSMEAREGDAESEEGDPDEMVEDEAAEMETPMRLEPGMATPAATSPLVQESADTS